MMLNELSDDDLLSRLHGLRLDARRIDASVLTVLIEVEERRLHLRSACSSLFDLCRRKLGMSEGAAFRRINAARLITRFPSLLSHIENGRTNLSSLVLLRDHLTEANLEELVAAASGKTKREIEELLACRAPRPDVPSTIRKLPSRSPSAPPPPAPTASAPVPLPSAPTPSAPQPLLPAVPPRAPARIEPLSEARYKLTMTASAELRQKLERAQALMKHRNPSGDMAVVFERALEALLEKLEKERLGNARRPRPAARAAKPGRISRAARREVFERDGEQCTFVDAQAQRCPARGWLELDHRQSRALGGSDDAGNLRVLCRAHNQLHAEEVFGREDVALRTRMRQRKYAHGSSAEKGESIASPVGVAAASFHVVTDGECGASRVGGEPRRDGGSGGTLRLADVPSADGLD